VPNYCGYCGDQWITGAYCGTCGAPQISAETSQGPPAPLFPAGAPATDWVRSAAAGAELPVAAAPTGGQRAFTIGREVGNDLVLDDPLVSKKHAQIELDGPPTLVDVGSFHGTYVNGEKVRGRAVLHPGVEVVFGNHAFAWDGVALVPGTNPGDFTLRAQALTTVVDGGKRLIDNVTFDLAPLSLTAVIGPSGAGKSTLLGALTGLRPATSGQVTWQGESLYDSYEKLRFQIGLVPQQDIQHGQLTVAQALGFAAELRLPPDTSAEERNRRVHEVAAALGLSDRMENRIVPQLSGGQRKRVSIATELLTAPPLLFLDEPTSGLDPGLDVDVMRQLRQLADDGRVVVVVTHSVLALDVCDNVAVLAPGGRLAYFGPPAGVLPFFGCTSYPEVFALLDSPALWQRVAEPPTSQDVPRVAGRARAVRPPSRPLVLKQLDTLVRRMLAVISSDRLFLAQLVGMPLLLGLLTRVVPGSAGLSLLSAPVGPSGLLDAEQAAQRLTLLIVIGALMGTAFAIRELVGERAIFQREYAVGLSVEAYLASKVIVLGLAGFVSGVIVTGLATIGMPGPDEGGALNLGRLEIALAIGLLTFTMVVVGIAISAVVTSTEQSMPALVMTVIVSLVLSGALFDVAGRLLLSQLSWLVPARWAYAATAATTSIQRPQLDAGGETDWIALGGAGHYLMDVVALSLLCGGALVLAFLAVRRSAVPR
jgi:ABC-type multidrug transport system ATPase subunit